MFQRTIYNQYREIHVFFRTSAGAGTILFLAAVVAMFLANSNFNKYYQAFLDIKIVIGFSEFVLEETTAKFINDALMAGFFLLVGLEIKRELLTGELSSVKIALLPTVAAIGGMVAPALIFAVLNFGDATAMRAWAVPTATDIAFSLGVLALLGARIPLTAKVFLTAIAVVDDLLAIVIIALFYSADINVGYIIVCALILLIMVGLNHFGIRTIFPYLFLGLIMWFFMHASGVHATIAGVLTAAAIPHGKAESTVDTPLMFLEHFLHTPVTYAILPLFAFANAGLNLGGVGLVESLTAPLSLGITLGLVLGKPIGIFGTLVVADKFGLLALPKDVDKLLILGVSLLCGIGFTVSLFIGNLAFYGIDAAEELTNQVKMGVFAGSLIAGVAGYAILRMVTQKPLARA